VLLMDDPAKEYYKTYEIEYDRNLYDGTNWTYLNLPVNEIKQFAKKSILADEGLYFSCDVGKQLNGDEGYLALGMFDYESVFNVPFKMNKKERILSFDSGSSHGMALMGVDTAATGKITKWLLENSWGDKKGNKGYLTMTDAWFDEYMFRVVVHKDYVSDKIFEMWQQKPIKLKPWDPMF
ncbi:MAG: aminopeptidase, partial [Calditrichia bacterium]|nr:aminopeptidase [Calditrichia bacterium]